jgi:hypothetical protein
MQTELNHTVKSIYGKESLDEVSREDLLLMTHKYPYSSILQFLYTRKLKSLNDLRYPASVAKTALYFSNPHWLHSLLRTRSSYEIIVDKEREYEEKHPESDSEQQSQKLETRDLKDSESNSPFAEEKAVPDIFDEPDTQIPPVSNEAFSTGLDNKTEISPLLELKDSLSSEEVMETSEQEMWEEQSNNDLTELLDDVYPVEQRHEKDSKELSPEGLPEQQPEKEEKNFVHITEPASEEISMPEVSIAETIPTSEDPEFSDQHELPAEHVQAGIMAPIPNEEARVQNNEPLFEPLYAIDYFASQGIKLRDEDQQDQLGKKLKSFTGWLKSMKKIHPEKSKGQIDEKMEESIKSVAEHSNEQAEVLTETMAEVFIKQGLIQKAIEVYEKLGLLDPAKSATFAAKISELKAIGT